MDASLVILLTWLFVPIAVYLLNILYQKRRIAKYPALTTGRVIDVSTSEAVYVYDYGYVSAVTVYYIYKVAGRTYAAGCSPIMNSYKIGDKIAVRYVPDTPEKSITWQPVTTKTWILIGSFLLAFDLGYAIFLTFFGIFLISSGIHMAKRSFPKSGIITTIVVFTALFGLISVGFLIAMMGIYIFVNRGFFEQNLFWLMVNS